jgi:hypothetical protein
MVEKTCLPHGVQEAKRNTRRGKGLNIPFKAMATMA